MRSRVFVFVFLFLLLAHDGMAADFVVKTKPGANITPIAAFINARVVESFPESGIYLLSAARVPNQAIAGVEYIEASGKASIPKQVFSILAKPTTVGTAHWYQGQPALQLINLPAASAISQGRRIVVADLNSAVDYGHPSLVGHLMAGYDFVRAGNSGSGSLDQSTESFLDQSTESWLDQSTESFLDQSTESFLDQATESFLDQATASYLDHSTASYLDSTSPAHGHGTLVAGIIAAIAPQAMIMPLRVFDDSGHADTNTIVRAIRYAVRNGASVINLSFGLSDHSKAVQGVIEYAARSGVVVVASAGNSNWNIPQFPAALPNVIAVAATTNQDQKAAFSNYGSAVDVSAPGSGIISTYPGGHFAIASGTSFAAPMVAAEAALVLSYKNAVGDSIKSGTLNIDRLNQAYTGQLGAGRIDLLKALMRNISDSGR